MQNNVFVGNVAKAPVLTVSDGVAVCRFGLIANEYAGKDKVSGEAKEKTVVLWVTAFGLTGEAIAKHVLTGDQLIVNFTIENNRYMKDGEEVHGYNFIVQNFTFGAAGKEKRELQSRGNP
jgi:single-strand DNA-binding protein